MIKFANSGIISFSTKPLIISIWIGIITSLLAFAELGYILSQFFLGHTVQGWASTVGIITLLFGILFILLGVIGLYLARIHAALQDRPKFIIDKKT
jgi:dolichol-phosphate mannosyltransferase